MQAAVPLWKQLLATLEVVLAVRAGSSGTAALEAVPVTLRPAAQALAFAVWRRWGLAQGLRKQLARKAPPPAVDALLCLALALASDEDNAAYDAFTLVNQTVEAAKHRADTRAQAGFLNGCLRRFLREAAVLRAAALKDPVAQWNHPLWWLQRLQRQYPAQWQSILQAANHPGPMCLRVNVRKTTVSAYLEALSVAGIPARVIGACGVLLAHAVPVKQLPGFEQGWVSVQDAGAQQAAPLLLQGLPDRPGMRLLDACAAPGGKTGHLLEMSDAQVIALDIDPRRCERISQNTQRLGLQAQVMAADAAQPSQWWDGQAFDGILLDAPCTASGIVRRHPDVRWLRRETDIAQLAAIQKLLLQTLWPLVRPGGRLLYCTCSVFQEEGAQQVQTFLAHNTDACLLPSVGHLLPQNAGQMQAVPDNYPVDHDGFFYTLFQKQPA
jgi:16S rRNA (cytosine967-C5)-methyltransferase